MAYEIRGNEASLTGSTSNAYTGSNSTPVNNVQCGYQTTEPTLAFMERLKHFRDSQKYCDVTLDVQGTKFSAHKNILSSWSPLLDSMFSPMVGVETLIINYDNTGIFSVLLDFFYSGRCNLAEVDMDRVLHLATKLQVQALKDYCEEFLRNNLYIKNIIYTCQLSKKHGISSLEEYASCFLQMNLPEAVKQLEFLTITAAALNSLLTGGWMESLKPEIKLFLIISWVGYDTTAREKYLLLLLRHISWHNVASDFLLEISRTENFFTTNESSLYLLLETLYGANICLGPYTEVFPSLRHQYSHIFEQIDPCSLLVEIECPQPLPDIRVSRATTTVDNDSSGLADKREVPQQYFKDSHPLQESEVNTVASKEHCNTIQHSVPSASAQIVLTSRNEPTSDVQMIESREPQVDQSVSSNMGETTIQHETSTDCTAVKEADLCCNMVGYGNLATLTEALERNTSSVDKVSKGRKRKKRPSKLNGEQPAVLTHHHNETEKKDICIKTRSRSKKSEDKTLGENVECSSDDADEDDNILINFDKGASIDTEINSFSNVQIKDCKGNVELKCTQTNLHTKPSVTNTSKDKESSSASKCLCPTCGYKAATQKRLAIHVKAVHSVTNTYFCNICSFKCNWVKIYYSHMKEHFPGPPFHCNFDQCMNSYNRIQTLLAHRMIHTNERPFKCEHCNLRFRAKNNLSAHIKGHSGMKPFVCKICERPFATKNTMTQHMVTHSDHRPYLCDTCGFSTKFQSHLIAHKRIHTGSVYTCEIPKCNYFTPKRAQMTCHMRTHGGVRNHVCLTCNKAFIEKSHLVRHKRIHLDDKPYKCGQCEYGTTRVDKLKEHIDKHHNANTVKNVTYKPRKKSETKTKRAQVTPLYNMTQSLPHQFTVPGQLAAVSNVGPFLQVLEETQHASPVTMVMNHHGQLITGQQITEEQSSNAITTPGQSIVVSGQGQTIYASTHSVNSNAPSEFTGATSYMTLDSHMWT